MDRRSWVLFTVLAAVWGASYMFIKVGLEDLSPAMIVFSRCALAALVLAPIALHRGALAGLRERLGPVAVLAAVEVAGPFTLIAVGEQEISSSLAGILVASVPLFTVLLAVRIDQAERSHGLRLVGVGLGFVGVALLLGIQVSASLAALLGAGAVLLAGLGYALGGLYLKRRLADLEPLGVVTATVGVSAVLLLPAAVLTAPSSPPSLGPAAAIAALGIGGTALAFVIFYTLIVRIGPARSSLVAYVAPGFAVVYGAVLLGERVTVATIAGLGLVIAGSWLAGERRRPSTHAVLSISRPVPPGRFVIEQRTGGPMSGQITIRFANEGDTAALERLAALDSAHSPEGIVLMAEVGGEPRAATEVDGHRTVADPFHRTAELVALLELRAAQFALPQQRRRHGLVARLAAIPGRA